MCDVSDNIHHHSISKSPFHKRPGLLKDIVLHPQPLFTHFYHSLIYLSLFICFSSAFESALVSMIKVLRTKDRRRCRFGPLASPPSPRCKLPVFFPTKRGNRWQFNDGKRFYECSQEKYFLIATYQMYPDVNVASPIWVSKRW